MNALKPEQDLANFKKEENTSTEKMSVVDIITSIISELNSDERFKELPDADKELLAEMTYLTSYTDVNKTPFAKFIAMIFSKLPETDWYNNKSDDDKRKVRNSFIGLMRHLKLNSKQQIIMNAVYHSHIIELIDDGCPAAIFLNLFTRKEWDKMTKLWGSKYQKLIYNEEA